MRMDRTMGQNVQCPKVDKNVDNGDFPIVCPKLDNGEFRQCPKLDNGLIYSVSVHACACPLPGQGLKAALSHRRTQGTLAVVRMHEY